MQDETTTRADELATAGVRALITGSVWGLDDAVLDLVVLSADGRGPAVAARLAARLATVVDERWRAGWQPADLHHVAQRPSLHVRPEPTTVDRVTEALADVVADDLARHPAAAVEPRWHAQLAAMEATVHWPASTTWVAARAQEWGQAVAYEAALRLEQLLRALGPLPRLGTLPGEALPRSTATSTDGSGGGAPRPQVDDKVLARVRQLLAKAESTPYEAEAETFTAGAQALMARHSIDHAMLGPGPGGSDGERPDGRRLWMETPYVREKVLLLGAVADANRSRSVWAKEDGYVTLLGFEHDLDAVETLYTSLLVQATRAMHAEGRRQDRRGGSRTRSFRQSFLAAFGVRIGERLAEVTRAETEAADAELRAEGGRELVPVLASRAEAVEERTAELFPRLRSVSMPLGRDREGFERGRRAADRAQLAWGRPIQR